MSTPSSLAGFAVLPVQYTHSATHYLYARAHASSKKPKHGPQENALPDGRTLFLVNLPPDATERELSLFFKHAGPIERVVFQGDSPHDDPPVNDASDSEDDSDADIDMDAQEQPEPDAPQEPRKKKRKVAKEVPPEIVPLPSTPLRTLRSSGHTAHVVFLDPSALTRALTTSSSKPRPWPQSDEPSGLAHYLARYAVLRPPLDVVREHADSWMAHFEFTEAQRRAATKSQYKKGEAIVDDDGFTLVTRGGVYGQTVGGGVGVASKRFQTEIAQGDKKRGKGRKKKEGRSKEGFYAFQVHEKKRQQLLDLKKNWEADKEKIEQLKASKKFKPY